jgi:hypothetical protein
MTIRARPTPPSYKVIGEMERSDERAARADAKVKRFIRSTPSRKPYHEALDGPAPPPEATPKSTGDLHKALMSVADQMLQYHDKPASLATVGTAFKKLAEKIKPRALKPEAGNDDQSVGHETGEGFFSDDEEAE